VIYGADIQSTGKVTASSNAYGFCARKTEPVVPRNALRCLLVDDSLEFIDAARSLLEREGLKVVGVASSGAEVLNSVEDLHPDVVLVDVDLGGESGFDLAEELNGRAVILISTHAEQDLADMIAASPAAGFLAKSDLSADAICDMLCRDDNGDAAGAVSEPPKK
jgi:DNA-binding NarL/FixJ family response regulator